MKRPLTGLVVAYAFGIWLGSIVALSWPVLLAAAGAFLLLSLRGQSRVVLLLGVITAGVFAYRFSATHRAPDRPPPSRD